MIFTILQYLFIITINTQIVEISNIISFFNLLVIRVYQIGFIHLFKYQLIFNNVELNAISRLKLPNKLRNFCITDLEELVNHDPMCGLLIRQENNIKMLNTM